MRMLNLSWAGPLDTASAIPRAVRAAFLLVTIAMACVATKAAAASDVLNVTLNKSAMLRFTSPVKTVVLGQAAIADVTVEDRRLMLITGKSIGETNLIVLDDNGSEIAHFDVIVVPAAERHVTIHRAADTVATYSCNPRCTVVTGPDEVKASTKAPAQGTAGAATAGTTEGHPATPSAPPPAAAGTGSAPASPGGAPSPPSTGSD